MAKYTIYEAKNNFSKLLQKAATGEEIVIMNRHEPVAQLIPIQNKKKKWGGLSGKIEFSPSWDAPIDDFEPYKK